MHLRNRTGAGGATGPNFSPLTPSSMWAHHARVIHAGRLNTFTPGWKRRPIVPSRGVVALHGAEHDHRALHQAGGKATAGTACPAPIRSSGPSRTGKPVKVDAPRPHCVSSIPEGPSARAASAALMSRPLRQRKTPGILLYGLGMIAHRQGNTPMFSRWALSGRSGSKGLPCSRPRPACAPDQRLRLRVQCQRHAQRTAAHWRCGRPAWRRCRRVENTTSPESKARFSGGDAPRRIAHVFGPAQRQPARAQQLDDLGQVLSGSFADRISSPMTIRPKGPRRFRGQGGECGCIGRVRFNNAAARMRERWRCLRAAAPLQRGQAKCANHSDENANTSV